MTRQVVTYKKGKVLINGKTRERVKSTDDRHLLKRQHDALNTLDQRNADKPVQQVPGHKVTILRY